MKIDGVTPLKGTLANRAADAKASIKKDGKSFAAAFDKASANIKSAPMVTTAPHADNEPVPEGDNYLETIKFRMKSGYYNTKTVDEALTEKLTGFFDELA